MSNSKFIIRLAMLAILLLSNIFYANSQELNCTVEINSSQIEGTDKSVFTTLQESITEYFRNIQ